MLTYEKALEQILEHSWLLKAKWLRLDESLCLVLAKDVFSPEPFPSFDNSAVDGYAVSLRGKGREEKLKVQGEIPAGCFSKKNLEPGQAVRIYTGAPVPLGTQAVVMQEYTKRINGSVFLLKKPNPQENIRYRGEDVRKGTLLVKKGTLLEPTHLALLAAVGYQKVPVYSLPTVAILATGSELLKAGEKMKPGKIRDSNSILLEALVRKRGGIPTCLSRVGDNPREIRFAVQEGLKSDILLISGGVSVGKYDFVREVLQKEGVREIFWKVNIKPGKPLFFGKKEKTLVFGLPGNPVSVFVTFEKFVKPVLLVMQGHKSSKDEKIQGRLTRGFSNGSRYHFVRVQCFRGRKDYVVTPLRGQGSHMIGELASANGLLELKPYEYLKKNQRISVTMMGEDR